MKCDHVQELLPLFVGEDLDEERDELVTAHLQSCAECSSSADEYRETRQLLQQFAPPPFSEAVYSGIRQRVLREIGQESAAPTLPQLIALLFPRRITWAAATALLIAVLILVVYFVGNRTNDRRELADRSNAGSKTVSPSSEVNNRPPSPSAGANPGASASRETKIAVMVDRSPQRKNRATPADRTKSVAVNTPDTRATTAGGSSEVRLADPGAVPAHDSATSGKVLRVEMQTKDPNIRIIWFSHQPTQQNSPSSKGI